MATNYVMFGGTGVPGAYQSIGIGAVTDSLFINGGQQQLTTTYGFRGAYTHNWDAYWNTAIYGAWAAVRHNDTAKALICTGPAGVTGLQLALSTGLAGCNPDFNYSAVGIITRWTPVRNLTFSVDTTYTMLDQKYGAGSTFVLAAPALALAKPAAVYEIKDQAAVSMLLRAQRNF